MGRNLLIDVEILYCTCKIRGVGSRGAGGGGDFLGVAQNRIISLSYYVAVKPQETRGNEVDDISLSCNL